MVAFSEGGPTTAAMVHSQHDREHLSSAESPTALENLLSSAMQDASKRQQDNTLFAGSRNSLSTQHSSLLPKQELQAAEDGVQHDMNMSGPTSGASLHARAVTTAIQLILAGGQQPTAQLVAVVAARLHNKWHQRQHQHQQQDTLASNQSGSSLLNDGRSTLTMAPLRPEAAPLTRDLTTAKDCSSAGLSGASGRFCRRNFGSAKTSAGQGWSMGRAVLGFKCSGKGPNASAAAAGQRAPQASCKLKGRTTCQVDGCLMDLSAGRDSYTGRYRVCARHMVEPAVVLYADRPQELFRFCNQCFKFEKLACFDGTKRGCRAALTRRRERQRLKKLQQQRQQLPPGMLAALQLQQMDLSSAADADDQTAVAANDLSKRGQLLSELPCEFMNESDADSACGLQDQAYGIPMMEPVRDSTAGPSAAGVAAANNLATATGSGVCSDGLEQQTTLLRFDAAAAAAAVDHCIRDVAQAAAAPGADDRSWAMQFDDPLGFKMSAEAPTGFVASAAEQQQLQHMLVDQQPHKRAAPAPSDVLQAGPAGSGHVWQPPLQQSGQDMSPEQLQQILMQGLSAPLCQTPFDCVGASTAGDGAEAGQPHRAALEAPSSAATSPPTMQSAVAVPASAAPDATGPAYDLQGGGHDRRSSSRSNSSVEEGSCHDNARKAAADVAAASVCDSSSSGRRRRSRTAAERDGSADQKQASQLRRSQRATAVPWWQQGVELELAVKRCRRSKKQRDPDTVGCDDVGVTDVAILEMRAGDKLDRQQSSKQQQQQEDTVLAKGSTGPPAAAAAGQGSVFAAAVVQQAEPPFAAAAEDAGTGASQQQAGTQLQLPGVAGEDGQAALDRLLSCPLWPNMFDSFQLEDGLDHSTSAPAALSATYSLELSRLASVEILKATRSMLEQQDSDLLMDVPTLMAAPEPRKEQLPSEHQAGQIQQAPTTAGPNCTPALQPVPAAQQPELGAGSAVTERPAVRGAPHGDDVAQEGTDSTVYTSMLEELADWYWCSSATEATAPVAAQAQVGLRCAATVPTAAALDDAAAAVAAQLLQGTASTTSPGGLTGAATAAPTTAGQGTMLQPSSSAPAILGLHCTSAGVAAPCNGDGTADLAGPRSSTSWLMQSPTAAVTCAPPSGCLTHALCSQQAFSQPLAPVARVVPGGCAAAAPGSRQNKHCQQLQQPPAGHHAPAWTSQCGWPQLVQQHIEAAVASSAGLEPSSNTAVALAASPSPSPGAVKDACSNHSLPACFDLPAGCTTIADEATAGFFMSPSDAAAQAAALEQQLAGVQQQMAQMQKVLAVLKAQQAAQASAPTAAAAAPGTHNNCQLKMPAATAQYACR